MSDSPERIGLINDGLGRWALATRDEADVAVHYILATPAALAASPDLQELLREARAEGMERAADIADPISIEAAEAIRAAAAAIRKGEKP